MSLEWAKQQKWDSTYINSDCKGNSRPIKNNNCNIVLECRELLQETAGLKLGHEGRETNRIADALAKYARGRTATPNSLQFFPCLPRSVIQF